MIEKISQGLGHSWAVWNFLTFENKLWSGRSACKLRFQALFFGMRGWDQTIREKIVAVTP